MGYRRQGIARLSSNRAMTEPVTRLGSPFGGTYTSAAARRRTALYAYPLGQPVSDSEDGGLGAVFDLEFGEDGADVVADGALG